jgi:rare lipoprotein A (peptidoglycan hydrolase)
VEDLRATRAKGRLVVAALAAVTMLAAPLALLHSGAATAATATKAGTGRSATTSPGTATLGRTQLVSADAPDARATPAQLAAHRSAVRHNLQLLGAARRRTELRHAAAAHRASWRAASAEWRVAHHAAAVRHNQALRNADRRRAERRRAAAHHRLYAHARTGIATWYAWFPGQCASPFLPHGTLITVTDLATHKTIQCLVTDTEAHNPGRVVDLSEYCFEELASPSQGVIQVRITW